MGKPFRTLLPLLLAGLLAACGPFTPPAATPETVQFYTHTPAPSVTPTLAVTLTPSSTPAALPPSPTPEPTQPVYAPMPTAAVTPNPPAGWQTYTNRYLGYALHLPPDFRVEARGFSGIDTDQPLPGGLSLPEYMDYLQIVLPGELCVELTNGASYLTIAPPMETIGQFVSPCPGMGIGSHVRMERAETSFTIGGQLYTAAGDQLFLKDTGAFESEFYSVVLPNGFRITAISSGTDSTAQQDQMRAILSTLHWTRVPDLTIPGWTCAGTYTRLVPGEWAVVTDEIAIPNRVRSGPFMGDNILTQIYPGVPFEVLEGPVCSNGLVYWRIAHESIPGGSGWTAEGDGIVYWVEPYRR